MQRRRKKRCPNWRGTRNERNVEIERGEVGFGITISGQKPCIVSAILKNSPADLAGVRGGDFLISINGLNVSKLHHEIIVQLINNSQKIWIGIANNYYKSDSSDDDSSNLSGRSLLGAGPKYLNNGNSNKLKGFRYTPQQPPQRMPHRNIHGHQNHHMYGYPSTSSSLPYYNNPSTCDLFCPPPRTDGHPSTSNSILIDNGQRDCVPPSLEYKIIVGYLGTIEMPGQLTGPRLQVVRQCIKKMRQEKRQPVAVLMTILPQFMTLKNANNQVLATYAANRLESVYDSSNGTQSDKERSQTNFALITTAYYNANGVMMASPERGAPPSSDAVVSNSCHVFMVNQKIVDHRVHFEKLSLFKIRCTRDPISNLCLEFPKDTDYVVNLLRSMYTLNVNDERVIQCARRNRAAIALDDRNEAAALSNSPQPSNHSELTTTSSNSDSGIGFHNDCSNICDRILVVDFPGLRVNNYMDWPNVANVQNRPVGISTERDLCLIEVNVQNADEGAGGSPRTEHSYKKCAPVDLSLEESTSKDKLTVRAMPFPKKFGVLENSPKRAYEERAVDVPEESVNSVLSEDVPQGSRDEFVFRAPTAPLSALGKTTTGGKGAKQRLNFFTSKLSPKVFGMHRHRPVSHSCENITSSREQPLVRRQLSEEMEKCVSAQDDEYIDIWGSVSEVDEQDCERLYCEIDLAQRRLDSAISEPNINAMAKSIGDDLIENCGNFSRSTSRNSPFRRYGQLSSSFRSELTATEAKKMLTTASQANNDIKFPARPRSFASSDGDVYNKTQKQQGSSAGKAVVDKPTGVLYKNTRVLDWNSSFERLLGDIYGVHAFAEFLRKEFSAENIYFWTACERYKQMEDVSDRYQEAQNIFQRHLESGAPEPVNIDSKATSKTLEQLKMANADLFEAAQKQIFNLMKFDSYARFIKSEIYKHCLDCEMKKLPPPYPENRILEEALSTSVMPALQPANVSPIKLKKSLSNAEDRRRKSLLPWHRKTRSKSKDRNEKESNANNNQHNNNNNNIYSSRSSLSSFDAVLSVESTESQSQRSQLCRVILPNGATTIVQTRGTETIRELVERLLEKRALPYTCFEVYVSGSNKACDIESMSTKIAGKQVNIEQRVTFKLDLPNKKIISVKSKPEKVLEEVLRPILHKYHYSLDDVLVHLRDSTPSSGTTKSLIKLMVTDIDGKRLTILDRRAEPALSTLHEITSRVFNEIMPEHQEGVVSVKKMADYMNCRFAGQQIIEPRKESPPEDGGTKKPVIAKWTTGVKLQSPTVASVHADKDGYMVQRPRDHHLRTTHNTCELPSFHRNDFSERPTPAPRLSITKNALQTSTSSMNNSQDSGILSNRSNHSTGTSHSENSMSQHDMNDVDQHISDASHGNDLDNNLKSPPPPLPPKPKVPIRGPNWSGSGKSIFLDQTSSSFV